MGIRKHFVFAKHTPIATMQVITNYLITLIENLIRCIASFGDLCDL
jgi:hypothetical protein